jgi:SAM-dependent methyltransferase
MPLQLRAKTAVQRLWEASEEDYREQILALIPRGANRTLLDAGCDDGSWTAQLAGAAGIAPAQVSGIEIVDGPRAAAQARGYDVRAASLDGRWPFEDGSFDIVHANQVIEHVHRLDQFATETHRLLRPGGTALICTENLASWHNVAASALGYQPFSYTNISVKGNVGNPLAMHAGDTLERGSSWQHVHVITMDALVRLFELHGFAVRTRFGSGYYPAFGRAGRWLARHDVRHAHFIGIVAERP